MVFVIVCVVVRPLGLDVFTLHTDADSVLYLLLVASVIGVAGHEHLMSVMVLIVTLSVLLHGISAVPLCRDYARRLAEYNT